MLNWASSFFDLFDLDKRIKSLNEDEEEEEEEDNKKT